MYTGKAENCCAGDKVALRFTKGDAKGLNVQKCACHIDVFTSPVTSDHEKEPTDVRDHTGLATVQKIKGGKKSNDYNSFLLRPHLLRRRLQPPSYHRRANVLEAVEDPTMTPA